MAIDKLSINDLLIDNIPSAPPPEDTPNDEPLDPQQPDLTCTQDPTNTKADRQVVGVENAGERKRMAKHLDCTTSITSTQKNGIYGIHFGLHTTVTKLNGLASKQKPG
jgi:hypothetical protein